MTKKNAPKQRGRGRDLPDNALALALWEFRDFSRMTAIRRARFGSANARTPLHSLAQERGITKPNELNLP